MWKDGKFIWLLISLYARSFFFIFDFVVIASYLFPNPYFFAPSFALAVTISRTLHYNLVFVNHSAWYKSNLSIPSYSLNGSNIIQFTWCSYFLLVFVLTYISCQKLLISPSASRLKFLKCKILRLIDLFIRKIHLMIT